MNSTSYHLLNLVNKDGNKLYKIILFILDGHSETFRGGPWPPWPPPWVRHCQGISKSLILYKYTNFL